MTEVFDYRNISYQDIYLEFSKKFPGKPDWLFQALSKHADMMFWYNEVSERNVVGLRNAVTDEAKLDGLYMLNYYPKEVAPVGASILIEVVAPYPKLINKDDLVFDILLNGKTYKYYSPVDVTVTQKYTSIPVFEGTQFEVVIGEVTTNTAYQRFIIPYKKIIWNRLTLSIDGVPYERKQHLMESSDTDAHFRNYYKDGYQQVEFGDGTFGKLPDLGVITVTGYTCNGETARGNAEKTKVIDTFTSTGASSQIYTLSSIQIQKYNIRIFVDGTEFFGEFEFSRDVISGLPKLTAYDLPVGAVAVHYYLTDSVTCTYAGTVTEITANYLESNLTGGSEHEDLSSAVEIAPRKLDVGNRSTAEIDFITAAHEFSPEILEVKTFPFYYGVGLTGVHIITKGGGAASPYLLSELQTYLNDPSRKYLDNSKAVTASALLTAFDFDFSIKMLPRFVYKEYMELSKMAIYLLVAENVKEYKGLLKSSGVQSVRNALNIKLGLKLPENKAGELLKVFELLDRSERRIWFNEVTLDTILAAIRSFSGIQKVILNAPTTAIITTWDRASTVGTLTCSEVL